MFVPEQFSMFRKKEKENNLLQFFARRVAPFGGLLVRRAEAREGAGLWAPAFRGVSGGGRVCGRSLPAQQE